MNQQINPPAKVSIAKAATNRQGLTFDQWCNAHQIKLNRNYKQTPLTLLVQWSNAGR